MVWHKQHRQQRWSALWLALLVGLTMGRAHAQTPALSINDAIVTEGNSGTVSATFTVTLSPSSANTVTVNFTTTNSTAAAPGDYTTTSGLLTFTPGQSSKTIVVPVVSDTLDENTEKFFVGLSSPVNATIADNAGEGTIIDDDTDPTLTIGDAVVTEGGSGTVNAVFTAKLNTASANTVTANFAASNSTAVAPGDYQATSGTVTFAPGETSKPIIVPVNGDTLDESDEQFFVSLSNAVNATLAVNLGRGLIIDNDTAPTVSINDALVLEGDSGTVGATFAVTLSMPSPNTTTVNFAATNSSAQSPGDYQTNSGTVTFAPGETSKPVTVLVNGDTLDESDEQFFVSLNSPVNAILGNVQGRGLILDDDGSPAQPTLAISDATVIEGDSGTVLAFFNVTLTPASTSTVTVNFATANNSAVAPGDYQTDLGTLTFTPGQTSQPIAVEVKGDTLDEVDERFFVNLSVPANAIIGSGLGSGIGTIIDDDNDPTLTIVDVMVQEGDSGNTDADLVVRLSAASANTVTVNFATANNSAVADTPTTPGDYVKTTGTLTFTPGQTSQTISVPIIGDALDEETEIFLVNLSNPTNATLASGLTQGSGIIVDDDTDPLLFINDLAVLEGNAGAANANFVVKLSAASANTVTVKYATSDGTATAPDDYTAVGLTTLTFAPGETSKTIPVPVQGDIFDESNETFKVTLSSPTSATLLDGLAIGTIKDNDPTPIVSINDVTVTEGDSGTVAATFTIGLSAPSNRTVTVIYKTADGTATAPQDYVAHPTTTLTFTPGQTSKPVVVTVNGDTLDEANSDTFKVVLQSATFGAIADNKGVGTILDDDALPAVTIGDAPALTEGNTGTHNALFPVTLSAVSGRTVTVSYSTADGTAKFGVDYAKTTGTITFTPGQTFKSLPIQVLSDTLDETNESFKVNLTGATFATIDDAQGIHTITDDDAAPTLSINDVSQAEGNSGTTNFTFTVTLSKASGQPVQVSFATADGTALKPGDYAAAIGTLTFAPGELTKTIAVTVKGDTLVEPNETFVVNLSSPVNATIVDGQGKGTILNNDTSG